MNESSQFSTCKMRWKMIIQLGTAACKHLEKMRDDLINFKRSLT